ncbi:hypoxanthine phosphoribosyltransferase [Lyngbya confervoides]|uniref:Hypoxanthine phosphoribosyltransferase n=1 Tax=Lyngbya confervoides BDU141951 TaxID=1574623 RepID=A0ABD4T5C1_9CYAN|nr:hypoxanthine phosphoribosyltransferase [Lyngbya confervoides]MCM1983836.1 hypoxanthine phosphoribosyltransferase [Lyngbya confervoides BDU141951]
MNPELQLLISQEEIAQTVDGLARAINQDYRDQPLILVGILKGAFVFLADLMRQLQVPVQRVELIRLSSYGTRTRSSGTVQVLLDLPPQLLRHQPVLLVEDIVDTGLSTAKALQMLQQQQPASLRLCALLDKPARRQVPVHIDYLGCTVPDQFIVGYGIDWKEQYRHLPAIYTVQQLEADA